VINSPAIVPTIAKVIESFNPEKMLGSADGKRIRRSVWRGLARRERESSRISASTERRPCTVFMTIGKMAIIVATAILDSSPVPNQTTKSGARAIFGTLLIATRNVNSVFSRNLE
jgi:hypothetical protein